MKRFSLESRESNRLIRIFQFIFGIVCVITAGWWAVYILKSPEGGNFWIATLFMLFFGVFQIYSGLGHASKYLAIDNDRLEIKKTAIGKKEVLNQADIEKIDILPLSVAFRLRSGKTTTISFPVTLAEGIDHIKDAVDEFGKSYNIAIEEKREVK